MEQNQSQLLPDLRQQIHDLTVTKRATGLSPPEEHVLEQLEAQESCVSDSEQK